jgi:hypothetical protein
MNKKYIDEYIMTKKKENKESLIYRYKDKFQIKYKKFHRLKTAKRNNFTNNLNEAFNTKENKII